MRGSYYNEIEPFCVEWLRNLIKAGHIAPGDVDDRSIADVRPEDLRGYAQCHFFAGLGAWSHALRQAGVADDQPLWTGSCPCQPFSAAGRGKGFADERHLWPVWADLIRECQPIAIIGEQVASKAALGWLDIVFDDLEDQDYACGAVDLPAGGVGAPHLRSRLFWVAHAGEQRRAGVRLRLQPGRPLEGGAETAGGGPAGVMANTPQFGRSNLHPLREQADPPRSNADGLLGHPGGEGLAERPQQDERPGALRIEGPAAAEAGVVGGFWRDADLIWCTDGRYRAVEPSILPLAHGVAARVGKLRAAGNAIVAPVATEFIKAFLDTMP